MSEAVLRYGDQETPLNIEVGTEGERAVDIADLRATTGLITLDPGFGNTAETKSTITFINGEAGTLRHRGHTIEDLTSHTTFLEVAYLLWYGELPTSGQLSDFVASIEEHLDLDPSIRTFLEAFPSQAPPMHVLGAAVSALASHHPTDLDPNDEEAIERNGRRLMAAFPIVIAWAERVRQGRDPVAPLRGVDYSANFLEMMFGEGDGFDSQEAIAAHALNALLILHADHGQNCSTSAVRLVGSSNADIYASIAAGVHALSGPRHGGANQAVLEMLQQISEDGGDVAKYIAKAKDKNDPFLLMGFGHRVYKNFDPRAQIIKGTVDKILDSLGVDDPYLDVAVELQAAALADDYFVERKLFPNVDFYSGIIYRALGFPTDMFPSIFALGRLPGWLAHWREFKANPDNRISRPRQLYVGQNHRDIPPRD